MSPTFPRLPIDDALPALGAALAKGNAAVLVAPPGAGKTTRVPLALRDAPWRGEGKIIVLEPRRLAARAAAARMAETLGEQVGETVGYRVRLDSRVSARTRIEVVTEGVFTRMILADPGLDGIAAVLFDEFHERSLDADLGLALARDAQALREDLRLLVMSATIDGAAIARHLGGAPVIESAGRAFPVETVYLPHPPGTRIEDVTAAAIRLALEQQEGSILVFLPGQGEIFRTAERLAGGLPPDVDLAPLYGQLDAKAQERAIQPAPPGRRKVVLATTVAQTSLTIEGIRVVIDSGLVRVPSYAPDTGLTQLVTRKVSRASADQRRGRAGRTAPGVCYRLWHEGQTAALPPHDTPEILEADLTGLVLDLADWGARDPSTLAFLDPPPKPAWDEAVALLTALGALDAGGAITAEGRDLARLPLHPRLGHMLLQASGEDDTMTAALVAAILSEPGLGGRDADLGHRLSALLADPLRRARDSRALAERWVRLTGARPGPVDREAVGRHLARAYPDRVAQAAGARGRFRLANGRGGRVEETDALAGAPFLVVAELTGSAAQAQIRLAAPIAREEIETLFANRIESGETLAFDPQAGAVRARRQKRLGALLLEDAPTPVTDREQAARLLASAAIARGVDRLAWSREQRALRGRVSYLHQQIGAPWPDLSDTALAADGGAWLAPHLSGVTALSEIDADVLAAALFDLVPYGLRASLEAALPSHFEAPSGSRVPIDYADPQGPTLSIRVQELFGLTRHPSVAEGRIPLRLVLLSPAQRPIQTTLDLPGFWAGSWRDVAKDLKGRYPKHFWPDDPAKAQATARAKPRG